MQPTFMTRPSLEPGYDIDALVMMPDGSIHCIWHFSRSEFTPAVSAGLRNAFRLGLMAQAVNSMRGILKMPIPSEADPFIAAKS